MVDDSFEGPSATITPDLNRCGHVDAWVSSLGEGFGGTVTAVPPLTGTRSLLLGGPDYCPVSFRLTRAPEHSKLLFDARSIDFAGTTQPIQICISSLGIGEDNICAELNPPWVGDEAFADAAEGVSQPLELSLPLPTDATDLWVEISATHYLWMDSLRTE